MRVYVFFCSCLLVCFATCEDLIHNHQRRPKRETQFQSKKRDEAKIYFKNFLVNFLNASDHCFTDRESQFLDFKTKQCLGCEIPTSMEVGKSFLCGRAYTKKMFVRQENNFKVVFEKNKECSEMSNSIMYYDITSESCKLCADFKSNLFCASNRLYKDLDDEYNKVNKITSAANLLSSLWICSCIFFIAWIFLKGRRYEKTLKKTADKKNSNEKEIRDKKIKHDENTRRSSTQQAN